MSVPKDPEIALQYKNLLLEADPHCWACGRDESQRHEKWFAPWLMHRAHLGSGSGSMLRREDRRFVNILCPLCHLSHVPRPGMVGVRVTRWHHLPPLTNANMIWLKMKRDPEFYDIRAITLVWMGYPPDPEMPDQWYLDEYAMRRHPWSLN